MDWNDYVTGELIEAQLAERRARAARERLVHAGHGPRPPWRVSVGATLIRLGVLRAAGRRGTGAPPSEASQSWMAARDRRTIAVSNLGH